MPLYTIFFEWEGGTYIDQAHADSVGDAIGAWVQGLDVSAIAAFGPSLRDQLASALEHERATRLEGLANAWCLSALIRGKLALIHAVRTEG